MPLCAPGKNIDIALKSDVSEMFGKHKKFAKCNRKCENKRTKDWNLVLKAAVAIRVKDLRALEENV